MKNWLEHPTKSTWRKYLAAVNLTPTNEEKIPVLFTNEDSIYNVIPWADPYNISRNALTFPGGRPLVAHPPCRTWGRLRKFSTAGEDDHALAPWAVDQVRKWGGVVEHPAGSALFKECGLPFPGDGFDEHGGWTLQVNQFWFGFPAAKNTFLYIVGCSPDGIPPIPQKNSRPLYTIAFTNNYKASGYRELPKSQRSNTTLEMALFLLSIARAVR